MNSDSDALSALMIVTEQGLLGLKDLASVACVCKTMRDLVNQSNLAWENTAHKDDGRCLTKTQATRMLVLQPRAFQGVRYIEKRSSYNRTMHLYSRENAIKMAMRFHGNAANMYTARVKRRIRVQKLQKTKAEKHKRLQHEMNEREREYKNVLAKHNLKYSPTMAAMVYIRYGNGTLDDAITHAIEEEYVHSIPSFKKRLSQNLENERELWGGNVPWEFWIDVLQQTQFETRREMLFENKDDKNMPECLRKKYFL